MCFIAAKAEAQREAEPGRCCFPCHLYLASSSLKTNCRLYSIIERSVERCRATLPAALAQGDRLVRPARIPTTQLDTQRESHLLP
jgi:hypothetical protein